MGGAYAAKPADTVAVDLPPGWNPDWPRPGDTDRDPNPFFPAPLPPGYTPNYSLVMTATDSIVFDAAASVTGSLRDYATYTTNEPEDSAVIWTASVNGAAVQLKFTGESLADNISSTVAYAATYWGAAPSIEFDLTEDNDGDTLVLTGVSVVDGITVTQTESISITATHSASLSFVAVLDRIDAQGILDGFYYNNFSAELDGTETPFPNDQRGWSLMAWDSREGETAVNETERNGAVCEQDVPSITVTVDISELDPEAFDVDLVASVTNSDWTFTATLTVDGTEYEKVISLSDEGTDSYSETWATIDGETGEVTILDP